MKRGHGLKDELFDVCCEIDSTGPELLYRIYLEMCKQDLPTADDENWSFLTAAQRVINGKVPYLDVG